MIKPASFTALLLIAACPALLCGQTGTLAPTTAPAAAPAVPVQKITIHPQAIRGRALKHALLPPVEDQNRGNAAPVYLAAAMQVMTTQNQDYEKLSDLLALPLDQLSANGSDLAAAGFALNPPALGQLRVAALRDEADWDSTIREEGYRALLPALSPMRRLSMLLAYHIRLDIRNKRYDAAIEKLQTGYAMAAHMDKGVSLVEDLVATAIAMQMNKLLLELIQQPDAPNLYWPVAVMPDRFIDLNKSMKYERAVLDFSVPAMKKIRAGNYTAEDYQQFMRSLSGLTAAFNGEPQNARSELTAVGAAIFHYPRAKAYLKQQGLTDEQIAAMPAREVLTRYFVDSYDYWADELHKWHMLPYPQGREGLRKAERTFAESGEQGINPLLGMIPALSRARLRAVQLDQQLALVRTVEALRAHAAEQGQLPAKLDDIANLPIPKDPVHDKPFTYERTSPTTAVITSPPPPGNNPHDGIRYEITLAK